MGNHYSLEDIRAWAEGRLSAKARARFEHSLTTDAELKQLAEAYRSVHLLSDSSEAQVPQSSLEFSEIEHELSVQAASRSGATISLAQIVTVAASLIALASVAWMSFGGGDSVQTYDGTHTTPLTLKTIPLTSSVVSAAVALPATLASYYPVSDGRIQWVEESEEADRIASATGRPLLVFGRYSNCDVADAAEESMADDLDLRSLAEQCVPVILELDEMETEQRDELLENGYPCLLMRSVDGDEVVSLMEQSSDCDLKESIVKGLGTCRTVGEFPAWQLSRDLTALCESAREAEATGRMAEAHRDYEELVVGGGNGLLGQAGERGLIRIALAARDSLLDARALCEQDSGGALRLLARSVEQFEGTPHVAEIALVLDAVKRTGSFPVLNWATK